MLTLSSPVQVKYFLCKVNMLEDLILDTDLSHYGMLVQDD